MADEIIPLVNDYDFSEFTDEELDRRLVVVQAILDQIDRMIAENQAYIAQGNDVDGRTKMVAVLGHEKTFKTDEKNAIIAEIGRRQ